MGLFNKILSSLKTPKELKIPTASKNMIPGTLPKDLALNNRYKTNVINMTCGCPEFQKYQHAKYAVDDILPL